MYLPLKHRYIFECNRYLEYLLLRILRVLHYDRWVWSAMMTTSHEYPPPSPSVPYASRPVLSPWRKKQFDLCDKTDVDSPSVSYASRPAPWPWRKRQCNWCGKMMWVHIHCCFSFLSIIFFIQWYSRSRWKSPLPSAKPKRFKSCYSFL